MLVRLTSSSRIARTLRRADRSATASSSNLRSRSKYQRYLRKISVAVKPVLSFRPRTTPAQKAKLLSAFKIRRRQDCWVQFHERSKQRTNGPTKSLRQDLRVMPMEAHLL